MHRSAILLLLLFLPLLAEAQITRLSSSGQPSLPRLAHAQVWTGTELLVWGGTSGWSGQGRVFGNGASYRPATGRWSALPTAGAPSARYGHTAVWTGKEMIVWGGVLRNERRTDTGARYNPKTRKWTPISKKGAPTPRAGHTAVWTGREMIVWGGENETEGAAYRVDLDEWRPITSVGSPSRRIGHAAVWTGRHMAVWGGQESGRRSPRGTGGLYDPKLDQWTAIATSGAPSGGDGGTALDGEKSVELVWTGSRLVAFPISPGGQPFRWWQNAGAYNPKTKKWTAIRSTGAPSGRPYGLLWTGRRLVAVSSSSNAMQTSTYNFSKKRWSRLNGANTGSFQGRQFIWAPARSEILVFGGLWLDGRGEFSGGRDNQRGLRIKVANK